MVLTTDEHTLVTAAQHGDTLAFTQLMRRHDPAMRAVVFAIVRNATVLDDVLQEAYLKAYRSLGTFKGESTFKTWLTRIAYNAALDDVRRNAKRAHDEADDALAFVTTGGSTPSEQGSTRLDVLAALASLPEKQRTAALLIDGHGYDYGQVATILDIPTGTVAYQLHQARKALRAHFERIARQEGETR